MGALGAPSCFRQAQGQAAVKWRVTLLLVGVSAESEALRLTNDTLMHTRDTAEAPCLHLAGRRINNS